MAQLTECVYMLEKHFETSMSIICGNFFSSRKNSFEEKNL